VVEAEEGGAGVVDAEVWEVGCTEGCSGGVDGDCSGGVVGCCSEEVDEVCSGVDVGGS
jgi:hypothetical protein